MLFFVEFLQDHPKEFIKMDHTVAHQFIIFATMLVLAASTEGKITRT